ILHIVPERDIAAHPHALHAGGADLVADALCRDLALELREAEQDGCGRADIAMAASSATWSCTRSSIFCPTMRPPAWRPGSRLIPRSRSSRGTAAAATARRSLAQHRMLSRSPIAGT